MLTTVALAVFPLLVLAAAFSDLLTMTIPNKISAALALSFLACALWAGLGPHQILLHLAGGLFVLALGFAAFSLGWMGGGDVKLAAAACVWFGFSQLLDYLLLAAMAGGALTLAILFFRQIHLPAVALGWPWLARLHDNRTGIPYGIALAAAALLLFPESPVGHAGLAGA
jgi:prepilin peptidase CpaA